ncbi:hypothetical protein AEQU2_01061 [Aequorivita lipolytica]|nr:hypothetical protein AEQU2_01061 [Aequorivita lipolytica]
MLFLSLIIKWEYYENNIFNYSNGIFTFKL